MSDEYAVTLNDKHRHVIQEALDMYSRVLMGQWEIIPEKLMGHLTMPQMLRLRESVDSAKADILGFGPGASHGIHNPEISDDARVAYDLVQVLRHEAWRRRDPGDRFNHGVDAYTPHKSSHEVPLAEIVENKSEIP